jgi:cytochrome-b5 reductase
MEDLILADLKLTKVA